MLLFRPVISPLLFLHFSSLCFPSVLCLLLLSPPLFYSSALFRFIQSNSKLYRFLSFTLSNQDTPWFTQICPVSSRFLQSHTDLPLLNQFQSDYFRFTKKTLSHSDSLNLTKIALHPFSHTQVHSDSHSFTPDSFCSPQTQPDAQRFMQIHSD